MTPIQQASGRCDCGALLTYTPTESAWEFDYRCRCGFAGVVSWAHVNPPPVFECAGPLQDVLFASREVA